MIIIINCKCTADISGNVVIGYVNDCYDNVTTVAAPHGRFTISQSKRVNYNPLGITVKAGTWIMGSLITFLR